MSNRLFHAVVLAFVAATLTLAVWAEGVSTGSNWSNSGGTRQPGVTVAPMSNGHQRVSFTDGDVTVSTDTGDPHGAGGCASCDEVTVNGHKYRIRPRGQHSYVQWRNANGDWIWLRELPTGVAGPFSGDNEAVGTLPCVGA